MNDLYIHDLGTAFRSVAAANLSRPALRYPDGTVVSYGELDHLSDQLAGALLELGVRRQQVVGILSNKSPRAYASLLACLKIGAIYTNLDVTSPWTRLEKIVDRCDPTLILYDDVDPTVLDGLAAQQRRVKALASPEVDELLAGPVQEKRVGGIELTGADPAYVMFTSGSTGFPKGAVMSHGNVLNFIRWGQTTFGLTPDDVLTNVNPVYFDNSVFDVYIALFSGASICPIVADTMDGPRAIVKTVSRLGCTIWFSVPSFLVYLLTTKALDADDFAAMRCIVFGGEGFPKPKLAKLYQLFASRARLVNVYGPTECTCICSAYDITDEDFEEMSNLAPLGRLAPNFDHYIDPLDVHDPDYGELWLGGPNVGLGYYNDPDRTAAAFLPNPTQTNYRTVMYRTGDLVRRDEQGRLHFKGRADNQIKHMGYRIELEEIEAGLNSLPAVQEAAVVYHSEHGPAGRILAYVAADDTVTQREILTALSEVLPPYMLPKKVEIMGQLPKNRNGKIDRVSLRGLA